MVVNLLGVAAFDLVFKSLFEKDLFNAKEAVGFSTLTLPLYGLIKESYDLIPSLNSSKLIFASPSVSILLIIAINSYFEAKCPTFLKNLLRFFSSI